MKRSNLLRSKLCRSLVKTALAGAAGIALLVCAAPAAFSQVDTSSPIVVKQTKIKPVWLKVEVIHGDLQTLMVREVDNPMKVHTFTYGDKAKEQMDRALAAGGYHNGDVIKVYYQPDQTVVLAIKGKPSKQ